ncbi:hypothetical protein Pla175_23880 [Pirellulimonas nuda]|uniref:Beta-hexosaminidase bacterial type N-terminal domain-containing protein n=1 Tax=Pirellulimonas nuda TaxID=2528009 RepID=A0A518DC16_9BACT|nr:hypothetical protein [Pirellulimonas nuda]QDU89003.1 hypothetical protein Pla175_23880 [Pirellulimonas nuda]
MMLQRAVAGYRVHCIVLLLSLTSAGSAEVVDVYCDSTVPQSDFAASEIQLALKRKGFDSERKPLAELNPDDPHSKIVLGQADNRALRKVLSDRDGKFPSELGEQAYAIRTTKESVRAYWVLGGDANGLMYGGLQLAENIRHHGLTKAYDCEESPYIKNRGVKYNLPLDLRVPTYHGYGYKTHREAFAGDAAKHAIPAAWDMSYWEDWFDEMARDRFNVISIWNCHPFPALLDMEESIQDVQGSEGYSKEMSPAEKVAFWKGVTAYAKGRGFQVYFITWNIYTYGAEGKHGITNDANNAATKEYFRRAVRKMFETYPDLDGLGVTAGENMIGLSADREGEWMWDAYGQGMLDYAREHPERDITFIHRWHYADISQVMGHFEPLLAMPNVRLDMSYKYSAAHMYSAPIPRLIYTKDGDVPADLAKSRKKTWLEVRQDDFYFLHWGDPEFARDYLRGFPDKDEYIQGFFYGSDGWTATRDFYSKAEVHKNVLDIKRLWYTQMLWGRLAYNPQTPNSVFIEEMASRYPGVDATTLFGAWSDASRGLPLATEVVQGTLCYDFNWWPELSQSAKKYLTIDDFIKAKPSVGSDISSIADSAAGKRGTGRTSYEVADQIEEAAQAALDKLTSISSDADADLEVNLKSIYAQAYLSLYYAEKIRAATDKAAGDNHAATAGLGKAVRYWNRYVNLMDGMFTGAGMQRTRGFRDWHVHDAAVMKEYTDLGGDPNLLRGAKADAERAATPRRYFVSLDGDDAWSGNQARAFAGADDGPFRTLDAARDAVRRLSRQQREERPIEICILPGVYARKQPFMLDARDSGTEASPVVYRSWEDQPVVISGGQEVRDWKRVELNGRSVLVADLSQLPDDYAPFEQLWVNGRRATQARTPNRGYLKIPSPPQARRQIPYAEADARYFDDVDGGVAVVFNKWLEYHMPLAAR